MAKQKDSAVNKEPVAEEPAAAPARRGHFSTGTAGRGWLYGAAAVIVLILVFLAGVGVANHRHRGMVFKSGNIVRGPEGRFGFGRHVFADGVSNNGQTRLSGVVTAVNGSGFTVASHGSTTNVTTNSSTKYQDGNQVKQNDSVIVFGNESNGSLTASQVVINP